MKRYILLIAMLSLGITLVTMSVSGTVQITDVPEGYIKLSDIGIYGNIYPDAKDILIPKELANRLGSNLGNDIQKIKELKTLQQNSEQNKAKSRVYIKMPEKRMPEKRIENSGESSINSGESSINSGESSILSSASVIFSTNVTKLWNKTFTGDLDTVIKVQDITGDGFDDALVVVYYPIDQHYVLNVIKGTNGQLLWSKPTAAGGTIYWNIIKDVDGDGVSDVLLTISKPGTVPGFSDFTVYVVKGTTGTILWQDSTLGATSVYASGGRDLNGDNIVDIIIEKNKLDMTTFKSIFEVVAKKGNNGVKLWNDSTSVQGSVYGFALTTSDLNGDSKSDVIIEKFITDSIAQISTFEVNAKKGFDGFQLWKDTKSVKGIGSYIYGFPWFLDLNKDSLADVLIERFGTDKSTGTSFFDAKANIGKNGTKLWNDTSSIKNGAVNGFAWPVGDLNADGIADIYFDVAKKSGTGAVNRTIKVIKGNNGVKLWGQLISVPTGYQYGTSMPIGDLNKDNMLDLFYSVYRKNPSSTTDYILYTKFLQLKNGAQLWNETLHGTFNQWFVSPYWTVFDLNGDAYNDILMEYNNKGNITIKVRKGPSGTLLWQAPFTKTSSTQTIDVSPYILQDINGDSFFDIFFEIERRSASQSDRLEARIGKNGSIKWFDSISGTTANFDIKYLGDANGDGIIDYIINGYNTGTLAKTYLYKIKNMKTGTNLWSESLASKVTDTFGQMYACSSGDLKGNGRKNVLKYAHPSTGSWSISAKMAPTGIYLWQITSNKDINACYNTYSNFNGDLKDDILFDTFRDVYAITTR